MASEREMASERFLWFLSLLISLKSEPIFGLCSVDVWEQSSYYLGVSKITWGGNFHFNLEFIFARVPFLYQHINILLKMDCVNSIQCPFQYEKTLDIYLYFLDLWISSKIIWVTFALDFNIKHIYWVMT